MMDVSGRGAHLRSVDAYELIKAYGRFDDYPLKQQDIHEFLIGFSDELETSCHQLKELWMGSSRQIVKSRDEEKPYTSTVNEDFNFLDLQMEDHKGNTFKQIHDSLSILM